MGWTVIPSNLALVGTWYVNTGTASTTYPVNNLNDWHHWNQAWITPAAGVVQLKFVSTNSGNDSDWTISGLGFVNWNCDGTVVTVKYRTSGDTGATNNYGSATGTAFSGTMDALIGNPNMLYTFAVLKAQTWYFNFSGGIPSPVRIGNVVLGPAFDLGYPERPERIPVSPTTQSVQTVTGLMIKNRITEPLVGRSLTFRDPTYMTKNLMYNRAGDASAPNYNMLARHFQSARQFTPYVASYNGVSAGAGIPCLYHEGSSNGLSAAGRPAFYGVWDIPMDRNAFRNISALPVTITDCLPRGYDVAPAAN